MLMKMAN